MRNEESGIPAPPPQNIKASGWVTFLIPNSYFLIQTVGGHGSG
jgi:hypothetical protein